MRAPPARTRPTPKSIRTPTAESGTTPGDSDKDDASDDSDKNKNTRINDHSQTVSTILCDPDSSPV